MPKQEVWVVFYTHKNGHEIYVFSNEEKAKIGLNDIMTENWPSEDPDRWLELPEISDGREALEIFKTDVE